MSEEKTVLSLESFLNDLASSEVYIHNHGELATAKVINLLVDFSKLFKESSPYPDSNNRQDVADALYTRMATLLSLWLSTEDIHFTAPQLFEFVLCKPIVNAIFYASGFRGTGHLVNYLSTMEENGTSVIHQNKLIAMLAVLHIDDLSTDYLQAAKRLHANYYLVLMMGWLNCSTALTTLGELNRQELVKDSKLLLSLESNMRFLDGIMNSWMNCTYFVCDNKTELKKNLNKMLAVYVARNFAKLKPRTNLIARSDKPRMLIIHERLTSGHAMFRCYKPHFQGLEDYFEVHSMVQDDLVDQGGLDLFKHTVQVTDPTDIGKIIKAVNEINPDIIYYPSLGMCRWTVILANIRLAKVQLMSYGHPDSSYSDCIDYVWSCPLPAESARYISEICLSDDAVKFSSVPHPEFDFSIPVKTDKSRDVIHIAVNCSIMKLNCEFMQMLVRLHEKYGNKVKFHFFPSARGFNADYIKNAIKRYIPSAVVYQPMGYKEFIDILRDCHLSLAPFPFGNTNSTVDALLLGLPVVARYGVAPYANTDQQVLNVAGLEQFLCHTDEQYFELASQLISDAEFFNAAVASIVSAEVPSKIFSSEQAMTKPQLPELLSLIYKKHNKIKHSGKRMIDRKDLAELELS
jgi:hypothetical protein